MEWGLQPELKFTSIEKKSVKKSKTIKKKTIKKKTTGKLQKLDSAM